MISQEHSFGSFCTQVLAVFSDRFELKQLLGIKPASEKYFILFERLAKKYPDGVVVNFLTADVGFIASPQQASRCLKILSTRCPNAPTSSRKSPRR